MFRSQFRQAPYFLAIQVGACIPQRLAEIRNLCLDEAARRDRLNVSRIR
jgi:hypothetical protein